MGSIKPSAKSNTATPFCKLCFKPMESISFPRLLSSSDCLCKDCFNALKPKMQTFRKKGIRYLFLYAYEELFKKALFQFKGCGDIELAPIFLCHQSWYLRLRFFGYSIVPVPSSPSHDERRGFNQVQEIAKTLRMPIIEALSKPFESKQSDLSAEQRKQVGKLLCLQNAKAVRGKKILLLDDVYTTGSTAEACVKLLQKAGARKISVLVLARVKAQSGG